jgi:hypothetical protein
MKTIEKYKDEISGRIFDTPEKALESEKKNGGIAKLFAFWEELPKDDLCRFANGGWCYQRSEADYNRLVDALTKAIIDYEPWIAEQYESEGGFNKSFIGPGWIIGRYLCDSKSELYNQYCDMSNICPKCFRQWGQQYYANKCTCSDKPKELSK